MSNSSLISEKTLTQKLLNLFIKNNLNLYIINKLSTKNFLLVFASGLSKPLIKCNKFISLNSTILSSTQVDSDIIDSNYVVFIDEGYPSHPDSIKNGFHTKKELEFIKSYNRFFDFIEKKYSTKVIIAKHPKSSINNQYFAGRKIFVNKTKSLILNSKFVIAHGSLINLFAVFHYKKMLLIYNTEMKSFPLNPYSHIQEFSKLLDLPLINIDNVNSFNKINMLLNKSKYELFIKNYISVHEVSNHKLIEEAIILEYKNSISV